MICLPSLTYSAIAFPRQLAGPRGELLVPAMKKRRSMSPLREMVASHSAHLWYAHGIAAQMLLWLIWRPGSNVEGFRNPSGSTCIDITGFPWFALFPECHDCRCSGNSGRRTGVQSRRIAGRANLWMTALSSGRSLASLTCRLPVFRHDFGEYAGYAALQGKRARHETV